MARELYPLKFTPIYMERIWGGTLMREVLHRDVPEAGNPIGESWEIVDRPGEQSVVANGEFAGMPFEELLRQYHGELLGPRGSSCKRFPLLVKLIDAGERLSLQVHPDENACREIGGSAEPKTEMWYIISALKTGKIMAGLSPRATRQQMMETMDKPEVENLLQVYQSQVGDAYFITSGTLHAIGEGNLILEIQQNSDTTYRVSDWGRVDRNGKSRELHVEKGLKSINFTNRTSPRIAGVSGSAGHNRKFSMINRCPFFTVDELRLADVWHDDTAASGSFHLVSAINAPVRVGRSATAEEMVRLEPGETLLVPWSYGRYSIAPENAGEAVVVRTTL